MSPSMAPEPAVEVDLPSLEAVHVPEPAVEVDLPAKTPKPPEPPVEVDLPALALVKTPEPEVANDLAASTPPQTIEPSVDFGVAGFVPEKMPEPVVDFDLIAPPSRPVEPSIAIDFDRRIGEPAPFPAGPVYGIHSIAMPETTVPVQSAEELAERERATHVAMETILVLEQWLDAIHAVRTQRIA
jgi:hypothetical protein